MRKMIKRLLKKYKYPPEEAANALETVIRQCKQWTDNDDSEPLYQKAPKKYEFPESSSYTITAEPNIKYNNLSEKIFNSSDKESIYGYFNKTCNDINKFEHDFFKKNNIEIKILPQKHINEKEIAIDILKKVSEEIENGNLQYDRECK